MCRECQFETGRCCDIWIDYQVTLNSLEEASELAHQNWIEIQNQYDRICQLEKYIRDLGLPLPEETF